MKRILLLVMTIVFGLCMYGQKPLMTLTPSHDLSGLGFRLEKTTPVPDEDGWEIEYWVRVIDDEDTYLYVYKKGDEQFFITPKLGDYNNMQLDYKREFSDGMGYRQYFDNLSRVEVQQVYPDGTVLWETYKKNEYGQYNKTYEALYLPGNHDIGSSRISTHYKYGDGNVMIEGYLVGNKVYQRGRDGLVSFAQKYGDDFFYCRPSDSITSVRIEADTLEILYRSGDRYKKVFGRNGREGYQVGTLHGKGYVINIKKNTLPVLTKDDGTKIEIRGAFRDSYLWSYERLYSTEDITNDILEGRIIFPDGKEENINGGHTASYWNEKYNKESAERKAEEEKKKAQEDAEKAQKRQHYIQKWGFYPGDYDNIREIIKPGRPFGAIKEYYEFTLTILQDTGNAQKYKLWYNFDSNRNYYVYFWVRNGKIQSVTY